MNRLVSIIAFLVAGQAYSSSNISISSNDPIIFPDNPILNRLPNSQANKLPGVNPLVLSVDDINNTVSNIFLSSLKESKAVADELSDIGKQEGFTVKLTDDGELWAEDNKWMSADGTKIYRPATALEGSDKDDLAAFTTALSSNPQTPGSAGYLREGHHSYGQKEMFGVRSSSLSNAKVLAESIGAQIEKTISTIDGGNLLMGKKANGEPYAIVGRDSVLATTLLHNKLMPERIDAVRARLKAQNRLYYPPRNEPPFGIVYGPDIDVDIKLLEFTGFLKNDANSIQKETQAENYRARVYIAFSYYDFDTVNKMASELSIPQEKLNELVLLFNATHHTNFNYDLKDPNEIKEAEQFVKREIAKMKFVMAKKMLYSESAVQKILNNMYFDAVEVTQTITQLQAGRYLNKDQSSLYKEEAAKKFLAMNELTKDIMAKELGVKRKNLAIVSQPAFHIDMHMRPLNSGEVMLNDPQTVLQLIKVVMRNTPETDPFYPELVKAKQNVQKEFEKYQPLYNVIAEQLMEIGLHVNRAPAVFHTGKRHINFINGIVGYGASGAYYITNASSFEPFNEAFAYYLQGQGITKTYFVGKADSKSVSRRGRDGENIAEFLLRSQGGLDCITTHISQ